MDNIQLCYIDNEINKIDKMKQGDVIYKNGMELLVVLSYDHNEPCKGCFFYKNKACGSEKLIKCWDCKKEYIFTAIRKYNTTELCGIVKRYEETYKIILKTINLKITNMKKEEKKFVTEYQINGKKYAGEIWATSWEEAECFIKQRASTEKAVGFIPKD